METLRGRVAGATRGAGRGTDIDGSRPDVWKYTEDVEAGVAADPEKYR